jgi:outer membrane protein, heavy metal efflux system
VGHHGTESRDVRARFAAAAVIAGCMLAGMTAVPHAQAQMPVPTPLTFEAALDFAASHSLLVEAARRARTIREAAIRTARQIPNPDVTGEATRETPHEIVMLDMPVELGGKRGRRIDLAREELSLADVDLQAQLRSLRRSVREGFYSVMAADQRVQLAESALDIARRVRDAAQSRFDAGAAPRLEVLQADLGIARAETEADLARGLRISAQAALNTFLNMPPRQTLAVAGDLTDHTSAPSFEVALATATASNPDLAVLDRQIAIEQRRIDLLRAERVPTPVFSVGGVFNAPGEFTAGPRAGLTIGLPLFSRNQGEIAGSIAATSQLRARRDATARAIENAVFGAVARVDAGRRQTAAYRERLVPTAANLESLAEEGYRAGRTSVLAVLDAQRNLRDLMREALQASLDLQMSLAELEELLGQALP